MIDPLDERALRKAWLKKRFSSFEYHEELVRVHEKWRNVLRKALSRAERDETPNRPQSGYRTIAEEARHFRVTYMPLIEAKPKPGDYDPKLWDRYHASGMFRSVPDYSRYLESEGDMLSWLSDDEQTELTRYWTPMSRMAENIQYTADDLWTYDGTDDWILDEAYTGPIDWPPDWRQSLGADAATDPTLASTPAGQPCPRTGWWSSPAQPGSRRRFTAGDLLPELHGDWGATLWQWEGP